MTAHTYRARTTALQERIRDGHAVLLSTPNDITYYSGFEFLVPEEREALLLVTGDALHCIQASFSPVTTPDWVQIHKGVFPDRTAKHIRRILKTTQVDTLEIDHSSLYVTELRALETHTALNLEKLDRNHIWRQRMQKDADEITALRAAAATAVTAWNEIIPSISPGITELELEQELERAMQAHGATSPAFPTIIAFGASGALPHYQPHDVPLQSETPVLVDFGATVQGYRSDISRSFWVGTSPSERFLEIEALVHEAYEAAFETAARHAQEKITAAMVDVAARSIITASGYGKEFIHTTGHGLGIDIHERPSINGNNDTVLRADMAITIEPGIYLREQLGYRYENTVLLTEYGAEALTLAAEKQPHATP